MKSEAKKKKKKKKQDQGTTGRVSELLAIDSYVGAREGLDGHLVCPSACVWPRCSWMVGRLDCRLAEGTLPGPKPRHNLQAVALCLMS